MALTLVSCVITLESLKLFSFVVVICLFSQWLNDSMRYKLRTASISFIYFLKYLFMVANSSILNIYLSLNAVEPTLHFRLPFSPKHKISFKSSVNNNICNLKYFKNMILPVVFFNTSFIFNCCTYLIALDTLIPN